MSLPLGLIVIDIKTWFVRPRRTERLHMELVKLTA